MGPPPAPGDREKQGEEGGKGNQAPLSGFLEKSPERPPEHIPADIQAEDGIANAERLCVQGQQSAFPLPLKGKAEEKAGPQGQPQPEAGGSDRPRGQLGRR